MAGSMQLFCVLKFPSARYMAEAYFSKGRARSIMDFCRFDHCPRQVLVGISLLHCCVVLEGGGS